MLNFNRVTCTLALLVSLAGSAVAGPLPTDPNAMAGWKSTSSFLASNGGFTLKVNVEYAVYAPGMFGSSVALGIPGAIDPSGGTNYVYAYEALNQGTGTALMTSLSVGLDPGALPSGIGNDAVSPELGTAPNLSQFIPVGVNPPSSAKWSYTTTSLGPGNHSDILFFTSPFGPKMILASMVGGHATFASSALPTPLPEPASAVLSALAALGMLAAHCVRRRRV